MVTRFLDSRQVSDATVVSAWSKKRNISINNAGIAQLSDFPLLIKLDSARIDYSLCQAGGADLRFFDSDGVTLLNHEIETWSVGGTSHIWVKVPQIDAGSTTDSIIMMYGNNNATAVANTSATWSSDYVAVYHMNTGDDSSANANNAALTSNVTFSTATQLGGRSFFDAALTPYLQVPTAGMVVGQGTIEAVVEMRTAPTGGNYRFAYSHTNGGNDRIYLGSTNTSRTFFATFGDNVSGGSSATTYTLNNLEYVVLTYSGLNFSMYFNGAPTDTGTATAHAGILASAKIGNYGATPNTAWAWDGYIHELRVLNTAKSAGYVAANYRAINDTYLTFGAEISN